MIGRYHRVRPIGPNGIGAPYVWDRGRAQDAPRMIPAPYDKGERFKGFTRYGEWWRSPEGIWVPILAGGAGGTYLQGAREVPRSHLMRAASALTQRLLALDSNYVNAASGDAIAARFAIKSAEQLSKIYFFITSYTGTAANVNDISCEFRNNSNTTGPGSTLHDSVVVDPASATGWISGTWVTGFTLAADTEYWTVVGDADGGITDFATVLRSVSFPSGVADYNMYIAAQTTDGWASVRTLAGEISGLVHVFVSGATVGNPFSSSANSTSSTNQRGLRFIAPAGIRLFGMVAQAAAAALSGINLWAGSNGPAGAADASGTLPISSASITTANEIGYGFETPPTLVQGTTYRLVFTYSVAAVTPARWLIGTGADASLRSAMLGGGNWYWTEADGTTDWSNDDTSAFPAVDLILEDFVTVPASPIAFSVSDGLPGHAH